MCQDILSAFQPGSLTSQIFTALFLRCRISSSKLRDTSSEFLFPGRPAIANNKVSSLLEDQDLQSAHFRTGVTSGRPLWSSCCAKPSLLASFSSAWITVLVLAHLLLLDLLPNAHRRLNESISLMYRTTSALMIGAHG
jgi:hypothetical protein